jgi:hypothetical protein
MQISLIYVSRLPHVYLENPAELTLAKEEVEARQHVLVSILCKETWLVRVSLVFQCPHIYDPFFFPVPERRYVFVVHGSSMGLSSL